jgi:hypothetical protein
MKNLLACLSAATLGGALCCGAAAQTPPSPDQARALQDQIQAQLRQITGGTIDLPNPVVHLTAEGDHYNLRLPLPPMFPRIGPADAAITARVRPLDGGRWGVENELYPSEFTFTLNVPHPAATPPDPGPIGVPTTYQFKLGAQDRHGVYDFSGATASTSSGTITSIDMVKTGGGGALLSHTGRISSQTSSQRVDPAHFDFLSDTSAEGYASKFELPDGNTGEFTADRLHVTSTLTGLGTEPLLTVVRMAFEMAATLKTEPHSQTMTPADRARMHALLAAARGLMTGVKIGEEADGLKFAAGPNSGALSKVEISFGGDAPQDMLSANMAVALEGLVIDSLPPAIATYVPKRFVFRPTASNISVADLTKLGLDATAPADPATGKGEPPVADYEAIFSHGGIKLGFDQLAFDIAGAKFDGTGSFTMTGPQTTTGVAQITADGLDGLISQMQGDRLVAGAAPVVIFLKGIAKMAGNQAVWQVTVDDKKVLVNGVDLGAMVNAMGGPRSP